MDGVIVDGMPFHVASWAHAFAAFGLSADERWFYELEGVIPVEVIAEVLRRLNAEMSVETRCQLYEAKQTHFREHHRIAPIPGIEALVESLHNFGWRLAVVTGSERHVALTTLQTLEIADAFSVVVAASDVERGKPAPDPYLKAVDLLGVPASNCLVIENAPAGITAAKRAGLLCLAITTTLDEVALDEADAVFDSLQGILAWISGERAQSGGIGAWLTPLKLP